MVIERVSIPKQRAPYQYRKDNKQAAYNLVPTTSRCLENSQDKFKMLQSSCRSLRKPYIFPEFPHWAKCTSFVFHPFPVSTRIRTLPTLLK